MGLTTAPNLATLQSWSLLVEYTGNTATLVAVGKVVYQALRAFNQGSPISPADLEQPLAVALRVSTVFKTGCAAKRHAWPLLHSVFSLALARYVIDYQW
jgi:hypothetical protein